MGIVGEIEVQGISELLRKLVAVGGAKFAKKALRSAIRKGGKPMLAAIKARAPVDSGDLEESLKLKAIKRTRTGVGVTIGTSAYNSLFQGEQFYGAFQEFGTAKLPPNPFMRPGFDETKEQSVQFVGESLRADIEAEARK